MLRAIAMFFGIALLPFWLYLAAFAVTAILVEPTAKMEAEGSRVDWFFWGLWELAPYFAAWFAFACVAFLSLRWNRQRLKT